MESRCKKCGKEISFMDDICRECSEKRYEKVKKIIKIALPFLIIIFGLIGYVDYNYELNKCDVMDSNSNAYDFTHRLEIDADYSERCYYIQHHPLAPFNYIFLPIILVGISGLFAYVLNFIIHSDL